MTIKKLIGSKIKRMPVAVKAYHLYLDLNNQLQRGMSDEEFLKMKYKKIFGRELDLDNPLTFNEKIQWLKLYDRKPIYTIMVDKYLAKGYIENRIGSEYIIPTLGKWDRFEDIDFSKLPEQFVLKCNHDCGSVFICTDKSRFDFQRAKRKLNNALKHNYYWKTREWPYKDVPPCILAEEYMEDTKTHELRDYKYFCFDGAVKALFIATDRQVKDEDTKFDFFDENFNHLPLSNGHPNANPTPEKPQSFEKMKELAAALSKGIPHLRVDFYEVNGRPYVGELTFSHWDGLVPFDPEEWDYTFGSWINLPK